MDQPETIRILENLASTLAVSAQPISLAAKSQHSSNPSESHESSQEYSLQNSKQNSRNSGVKAVLAQLLQQQGIRVMGGSTTSQGN